ncbi:MAG: hypothetical protein PHN60_02880 [Candidatus Gracilibacteria bacterium]|nr:hypothetical protein [Candidatus Gracilibacteria bacterium]
MPETTPEIKRNPEIKTPGELIRRLEAKSQKTLADKVRTIEQTVTDGTESKWKKLQSELPDAEKKEIEKILKDENPEVGNRLKTVAGATVGATGIALAIDQLDGSMEKTGLGKLGIKESIKEWITETLTEELPQDADFFDKFMHKIKMMFLTPFAKIFGVNLAKKEGKGDGKKEEKEGKKDQEDKEMEKSGNYKYVSTIKAFVGFYQTGESKDKAKIQDVFLQEKFQQLSFSQAKDCFNSYKANKNFPLKETIGIKGNISNENIYTALGLLFQGKSNELIEKKFSSNEKNKGKGIGDEKIHTLVQGLHEDIAHFGDILGMVPDNIGDIKQYVGLKISKTENGEFDISGPLKEKANSLGLSKEILVYMGAISPKKTLKKTDELIEQIDGEKQLSSDNMKTLQEKILPFAHAMQSEIIANNQINLGVNFTKIFKNSSLDFSEILKLYIITGGKTNFSSMNSFEQLGVYAFMSGVAGDRGENVGDGNYSYRLGSELLKTTNSIIPDGTREIGMKVLTSAGEFIGNTLWSATKWTWGVLEENPVAAAAIVTFFVFGNWLPRRTSPFNMVRGN